MKKIVKRRKFLRINTPLAFGVLCALVVLAIGGVAYGLGAGVIAPVVRTVSAVKTQQLATQQASVPEEEPAVVAESAAADTPEQSAEPESTPEPTKEPEPTATPEPETTPEPVKEKTAEQVVGEDQGPVGANGRLSGHTIAIDAAKSKGGKHKGYSTKTPEYQINFTVAQAIKSALEAEGATVVMTRNAVDDKLDDSERAKIINDSAAELTVSVMCNTVGSHDIRGTQVIVSSKKDTSECKKLAKAVIAGYKGYTDMPVRGDGDGVRTSGDWGMINKLKKPACLLILGHISNKQDDKNLADEGFIARGAQGIVNGIIDYLG